MQHYVRTTLRDRSWVTWSLRWNIRFLVAHDLHADLAVEGNSYVCFLIHFEEHVSVGIARDTVCAASEIQRLSTPVRSPGSIRDFKSIFAGRKVVVGNGIILQFASILAPVFAAAPSRTCYSISGNIVSLIWIKRIRAITICTDVQFVSTINLLPPEVVATIYLARCITICKRKITTSVYVSTGLNLSREEIFGCCARSIAELNLITSFDTSRKIKLRSFAIRSETAIHKCADRYSI